MFTRKSKTTRRCLLEGSLVDEKEAAFSSRLISHKRGSTYAAEKLAGDSRLAINPRKEYDFGEALRNISGAAKTTGPSKTKYQGMVGCV